MGLNQTPLKSIRKRCLDCKETRPEIKSCEDTDCSLHPFRMGKGRPKLKDIRAYCRWCCLDQDNEIKLCPSEDCFLWVYRLGKNPSRKGIGGIGANKEAMQKIRDSRASKRK